MREQKGGDVGMKLKMLFVGLLVMLFALNALPAHASDFSGYAKATYGTDYTSEDVRMHTIVPRSRKTLKFHDQFLITNVAAFPMTEAIFLIRVTYVGLHDADGNVVLAITDPAEIAQVIRLENSDELWQGNNVIWLGTIQPGHSRRLLWNWWIGELLASWEHSWELSYEYATWQGVWYLP